MIPHRSPEQSLSEPQGFSFLEYDKAREKIPESTRASVDAWRDEILEICRAHGVDHPSKLVLAETHASSETLARVQNLLDDILYVFEHQELPTEKKEREPVDDHEYVLPLDIIDTADFPPREQILDQKGRFLFLDDSKEPNKLFDCEGNKDVLPANISYQEFALLGSRQVLVARQEEWTTVPKYFLIDLEGERIEPSEYFIVSRKKGKQIIAVGEHFHNEFHPVGEDGTIHWNINFSPADHTELKDAFLIAGRRYFLIRENALYKIYTADHTPVGDHKVYLSQPLLCEKEGKLIIIARGPDPGGEGWWIYNNQGDPVKKLPIPSSDFINEVTVKNGICVFAVRKGDGTDALVDEKGHCFWVSQKGAEREKIFQLSVQGSRLTFQVRRITYDAYGLEEVEDAYYDQEGKPIVVYSHNSTPFNKHPIFVGGSYAYVGYDNSGKGIHHGSFPEKVLGTFQEIYAMEVIDADRFYVIGIEKREKNHYQLAKRVYDTRKIEESISKK